VDDQHRHVDPVDVVDRGPSLEVLAVAGVGRIADPQVPAALEERLPVGGNDSIRVIRLEGAT